MSNTLSNFSFRQREFIMHYEIIKYYGLSYVMDINNNVYDIISNKYIFLHFYNRRFFLTSHPVNTLLRIDDSLPNTIIITVPLKRIKTNSNPLNLVNIKVSSFNAKIAL